MKAYVYLARRDGSNVRIIAHLNSKQEIAPTRINDVKQLNLPAAWESAIGKIMYAERMKWQTWIETAETYAELRKSLYARKFKKVPPYSTPKIFFPEDSPPEQSMKTTSKTMMRRNNH